MLFRSAESSQSLNFLLFLRRPFQYPLSNWQSMNSTNMSNLAKQQFSICPTNGRQTVGDGAFYTDMTPSVLAVCRVQGTSDMYYYSTTFSGGPGWRF